MCGHLFSSNIHVTKMCADNLTFVLHFRQDRSDGKTGKTM